MDINEIIKANEINNKIISSSLEKSSLIIKLVYEIKETKFITLFGENFFKRNEKKLKIIINNKFFNLTNNRIEILNNKMKILKIKLIILNSSKINFSEMFYNCDSLKYFSIITKDEPKSTNEIIDEQKDNQIDSLDINNSEEINKYSQMELYHLIPRCYPEVTKKYFIYF